MLGQPRSSIHPHKHEFWPCSSERNTQIVYLGKLPIPQVQNNLTKYLLSKSTQALTVKGYKVSRWKYLFLSKMSLATDLLLHMTLLIINTDAMICGKHFTVGAAWGGTSFNQRYSLQV